jgi:hypothetical protein
MMINWLNRLLGKPFYIKDINNWYKPIKIWYNKYGELHNPDGPAVEYKNGTATEYWINGKRIFQLDGKRIYGKNKIEKYAMLI